MTNQSHEERLQPAPLLTQRLQLRPFTDADAQDVFAACSNPVLGTMAGWPPHTTIEDSLFYIREIAPSGMVWALCEQGEGSPVIGSIGLLPDPRTPGEEGVLLLGYWLHEDYWNRGYMTEAALAVLDWARVQCAPSLFTTSHFLENIGSQRVIEKCGFTCVGQGSWEDDPRPVLWYEMR